VQVNNMVDTQREHYMLAYEKHMYNVQIELHALREKVTEIANDKTRDEKVKQVRVAHLSVLVSAIIWIMDNRSVTA
jgi:hypothetical protein